LACLVAEVRFGKVGRATALCPIARIVDLLGNLDGVIDLAAKVVNSALSRSRR
jgi:hypothetical protein